MSTTAPSTLWQKLRVAGQSEEVRLETMTVDELDEYFSVPTEGVDEDGKQLPLEVSTDMREIADSEIDSLISDITKRGSFILAFSEEASEPWPKAFLEWKERQKLAAGSEKFLLAEKWGTISKTIRKRGRSKKSRATIETHQFSGLVHCPQEIAVVPTGELKPCYLVNWKGCTPTWEPVEMLEGASNFRDAWEDWDFNVNGPPE